MVPVWLKSIPSNKAISIFSFEFSVEIASYAGFPAAKDVPLAPYVPMDRLDLANFVTLLNRPLGPSDPFGPFDPLAPFTPPLGPFTPPLAPFTPPLGPSAPLDPIDPIDPFGLLAPLAPPENCDNREIACRNSSMLMVPVLSLSKNSNAASSCRSSFYPSSPRGSPTLFRWYATAVIAAFFSRLNP